MKEVTSKNYPRVTQCLLYVSIGFCVQYIDLNHFMLPNFYWAAIFVFVIYFCYLPSTKWAPQRLFRVYNELLCDVVQNQFLIPESYNKTLFFTFQAIYQLIPARKKGMSKLSSNYNSKTVLFIRSQLIGILYKAGDVCWW